VYGVALAKTERTGFCPNPQNDQIPQKWDQLWQHGEAEAARKGQG
jgi:hypothetical protein